MTEFKTDGKSIPWVNSNKYLGITSDSSYSGPITQNKYVQRENRVLI